MIQIVQSRKCPCGKRCHSTEDQAKAELRNCRAQGRCEQRYYHCHLCSQWHLTSQPLRRAA